MVVGFVAGAGTAFVAAGDPRTESLFGVSTSATADASDGLDAVAPFAQDDPLAELDRMGLQGRTAGRSSGEPDPVVAPSSAPPIVDGVPSVAALPPGLTAADVSAGLLSANVPEVAGGSFVVVPGSEPGPGIGAVRTVRVEVEQGLAVDGAAFAATVMSTLNDPRSWGGDGSMSFARTDGEAEIRVLLASPKTVDALCAPLRTGGEVSCGRAGHAALNLRRWVEATPEFASDKTMYRQYLVNHEVGHLLGHQHARCGGAGKVAPVMQQQSYQVAPCLPNAWPFP
ncbi:DUF3152 domain-containing protein [Cellulomonas sp. URHD0024]|uniref:DUF3152 domain-containing protein n=1 Tax=Cellulomonas sp. URHD0024 TaxID=1302620 RepID=UPI0009DB81F4|nr:DUF3152 domain-containing protein [Cellulomonas sp. URHD0024]